MCLLCILVTILFEIKSSMSQFATIFTIYHHTLNYIPPLRNHTIIIYRMHESAFIFTCRPRINTLLHGFTIEPP